MTALPGWVDGAARERSEARLAELGGRFRPEQLRRAAQVLAKWAVPGMCNPADETAVIDGEPGQDAARRDARGSTQRNHDALGAMVRAVLCSGQPGSHRGLPVSIIVTARLEDLEAKTGAAITGGGSVLPISDVIRLARHAHPLPDHLRRRRAPAVAGPNQTAGLPRAAHRAARHGPRLLGAGL